MGRVLVHRTLVDFLFGHLDDYGFSDCCSEFPLLSSSYGCLLLLSFPC